jgi:shikimate dehydrogenase
MNRRPEPENQVKDTARSADAALAEQRALIDRLDTEILRLVNQRLEAAVRIGAIKKSSSRVVRDIRREVEVLERLLALNRDGKLPQRALLKIYSHLFAAAREVQGAGDAGPCAGGEAPALFAVFGEPIGHSLSPVMHQAAFCATGFNAVYVPVRTDAIGRAVEGLRALGIKGASITIPHKQSVMAHLDRIDATARSAGAVNTLVNTGAEIAGYNTDCEGAARALLEKTAIAGRAVAVIGAGGAARAVVHGVLTHGGRPTLFNRSAARGERVAAELGVEFRPLAEFSAEACQILVNTTPLGMAPHPEQTPVPRERLASHLTVMDIVYNPRRTRLLREAEALGCTIIDGLSMFVWQGARQFELWTGMPAPVEIMRLTVAAEL